MATESERSSRAASEAPSEVPSETPSEAASEAWLNGADNASSLNQGNDGSIITDLPVMHTAKRLKIEARKLDGMQRELYNLMGDNTPPVVVTPLSKFKTRPEWQQRAAAWKLVEFSPKEGLKLKHWVRAASLADGTSGDRFARFNTPVNVPHWSDADYALFADDNWSLDETRYLFDLAKEYDLRWLVIADRYDFGTHERSVDDLKERYYSVCSSLIRNKPVSAELGLSPHDEELLKSMDFNKESEEKRKSLLERLLSRSPKEVAEEEALILEARRLESMAERIVAERKDLMRLLESPAPLNAKATKADLSTSQGVGQLLQELQNEKGRKASTPANGSAASGAGAANARKIVAGVVSKILNRKVTSREEAAIGVTYLDSTSHIKHPGVHLRSAKLTPIRQNILPKARAITTELGLPIKPVMPTAKTCAKYEKLYHSITVLLEAKKIQDKLEMEISVLKAARDNQNAAEDPADPVQAAE